MPTDIQSLSNLGLVALILLVILFFFYRVLYRTFLLIKPENRKLPAYTVWLLFLPGFNIVWLFVVVGALTDSLAKELESRNYEVPRQPAFRPGMGYAVFTVLGLLPYLTTIKEERMWVIGLIGVVQLIFMVQYWMKISWYKRVLENTFEEETGGDDETV